MDFFSRILYLSLSCLFYWQDTIDNSILYTDGFS